jgi:hypothetical protein
MRGQVVREKLHGRTARGTWMQLEKTPAAFGQRKLPSLTDLCHLMDYVVYRITRSNVGPWGLSRLTERHPMYLSPDLASPASLTPEVAQSVARTLRRIEKSDDVTAASADLAARFPPPKRSARWPPGSSWWPDPTRGGGRCRCAGIWASRWRSSSGPGWYSTRAPPARFPASPGGS